VFLVACPEPVRRISGTLRGIVTQAMPDVIERVRAGWRLICQDVPAGRRTSYFCYIAPEAICGSS